MHWVPERITVLRSPRFAMSELPSTSGKSKQICHLIDVSYVVTARLDSPERQESRSTMIAAINDFEERVQARRPLRKPFFGLDEFPAQYALLGPGDDQPAGEVVPSDLGWLLYDTRGPWGSGARFFRPRVIDGSFDLHGNVRLVS